MNTKVLLIGLLCIVFFSCKKDNNDLPKLREYSEVAIENDTAIQEYLKTHFYNVTTDAKTNKKQIELGEISGSNANKKSLFDDTKLQRKTIRVKDLHGNYINHTMYYLILEEGNGVQASVADLSYLTYKGQTLQGRVFDQSTDNKLVNWFDLLGDRTNGTGVVVGFREAVALLKSAKEQGVENPDGTLSLPQNYGLGIFFMPAGITYFTGTTGIPAYSPIIFEIGLIRTKKADHDNDGIPSIEEIKHNPDGTIEYPDCNDNYKPDYLDALKCN